MFAGPPLIFFVENEELFVGGRVKHHGQPAGVIVAKSFALAHKAAALVRIDYAKPPKKHIKETFTNMQDVLAHQHERKARVVHEEFDKTDAVFEGQ